MSLVSHSTTTIVEMDAASKALAEAPPDDARTWAARADSSGIPLTTLYNRHRGRPSKEEIAQRQQYLTVEEEKALVAFLLLMCSFGQPVRIKYIPRLAFSIAQCRTLARPNKPPGKNWAQALKAFFRTTTDYCIISTKKLRCGGQHGRWLLGRRR